MYTKWQVRKTKHTPPTEAYILNLRIYALCQIIHMATQLAIGFLATLLSINYTYSFSIIMYSFEHMD